ncbi:hypothetical protein SV7mr_32200 [Stieleria bergensis]|uniref:Uncharacterized protein n=1 Tax=Stieleria bergensis TaxID=2528025 RepID=A0A517SX22_9BACT|nr:hypothetical protein SV7mr_32200 [Planctomycetes bacterium SV_7m_r]
MLQAFTLGIQRGFNLVSLARVFAKRLHRQVRRYSSE